jgi:hypothetical protein
MLTDVRILLIFKTNSTGKEVAKFAKLKYPELVLEQLAANNGDLHVALRESFHRVDELLEDAVSKAVVLRCTTY